MSAVPKTFLIGVTQPDVAGLFAYLTHTAQTEFLDDFVQAQSAHGPICLASFYAKLCYKSLVAGRNANVTAIREIEDNLKSVFASGHGSVFEHVWLNFITTDCSRVFTHELVRHRVGTAFSQTSGRYVAIDEIDLVLPPELRDVDSLQPCPEAVEDGDLWVCGPGCAICRGEGYVTIYGYVERLRQQQQRGLVQLREMLIPDNADFATKKRLTSAIRRLAPNGQTNEIGWSVNVRSLRHLIELRTSRHAEWEIRVVFDEVARIVGERWPLMLHGGQTELVDGLLEWTKLKV